MVTRGGGTFSVMAASPRAFRVGPSASAGQVTGRSPGGHPPLKAKIETLQAELAKLEAMAGGHRADFESERDQKHKLMAEFLKMIAITMTAKEATARLEGELSALKARPWWRRLAG